MTDECTASKLRVSYARVLVEMDITVEMKDHITFINPKGQKIVQEVMYEWKPPYCKVYNLVGHSCQVKKQEGKKPQQKWERKEVTGDNKVEEEKKEPPDAVEA